MAYTENIIVAACSDLAGQVRGKGFPAKDLQYRLARGVGWTPTNVQITCFDGIAESPFGARDDLVLIPDATARLQVEDHQGTIVEDAMLGDIRTLAGEPWPCCTRSILKAAIQRLDREFGLRTTVAFEQEFQLDGLADSGTTFSLGGARAARAFGQRLIYLMRVNGLDPETFLREFGADQYEVTVAPGDALRAADQAVLLRELVRIGADEHGLRASFTPMRDPEGVGNGVHIHISLKGPDGEPVTHDPETATGLSARAGAFVAGITTYLPAILALLAPSAISYLRLKPHRWSASYNNLAVQDREAAVRVCPTTALDPIAVAEQFNFEVRAADAAASPHLALAALLHAGAEGLARALPTPIPTEQDLSALPAAMVAEMGYRRLPESLGEALDLFAADDTVTGWFADPFPDVYVKHKRGELDALDGLDDEEICRRYRSAY